MLRWLAAILIVLVPIHAAAVERDIVAVFDIAVTDAPGFKAANVSKYTALLDSVVAAAGYRTVPRSEIRERLTQEQAASYRPCYDDTCQIEIGKALAAQKAVSTAWARFDQTCTLTLKIYDLKTAVAEYSTRANAPCDASGLRAAI